MRAIPQPRDKYNNAHFVSLRFFIRKSVYLTVTILVAASSRVTVVCKKLSDLKVDRDFTSHQYITSVSRVPPPISAAPVPARESRAPGRGIAGVTRSKMFLPVFLLATFFSKF